MRKILGLILIGLGGFLLVLGLLTTLWVPGQVKQAPIDTDSITRLSGTAAVVPSGDTNVDVRAVSITQADSNKSDDDVVVYANYTCLVLDVPGPRLWQARHRRRRRPQRDQRRPARHLRHRPHDGRGGQRRQVPAGRAPRRPRAWSTSSPSTPQKQDYEFWDGVLNDTVTAKYEGTEKIDGLETYKFNYVVDRAGRHDRQAASRARTAWTRPCGSSPPPARSSTRSSTTCAPSTARTVLDVQLSFTDDQVKTNADDAEVPTPRRSTC